MVDTACMFYWPIPYFSCIIQMDDRQMIELNCSVDITGNLTGCEWKENTRISRIEKNMQEEGNTTDIIDKRTNKFHSKRSYKTTA